MTEIRTTLLAMELEYTKALELCRVSGDGLGATHIGGALEVIRRILQVVKLRQETI